jgi:hypothetical protein
LVLKLYIIQELFPFKASKRFHFHAKFKIIKQGSNQAIRFFIVESLKEWYKGGDTNKKVPMLYTGLFGGIAGACSH